MMPGAPIRERGWLEVRWRQLRNAPQPVVRAVVANVCVALAGAGLLLAYDVALARGSRLPGGDLRPGVFAAYVVIVCGLGALLTYLWVPLPSGSRRRSERRRSWWSGMLGLLAAIPAAYLALVVCFQVIRPLLG